MTNLRAAPILIAAILASQASAAPNPAPNPADQQRIVDSARQYALAYTASLPNFICTQVTDRDQSTLATAPTVDSGMVAPQHGSSDRIVEKLTYFNQQENYEVISVKGVKAVGVQHTQLDGATSTGEFGSAMHSIFDPESQTVFTWHKPAALRGRHVFVLGYQVPREAGVPVTALNNLSTVVAYRGEVFVDQETLEILRITTQFDLPRGFPIESAHRFVDYQQVSVAGKNYNLPFHSEVTLQHSATTFTNKIDFKDYRKFTVESTIRFGAPPDQASLPAEPSPIPAPTSDAVDSAKATPPPATPEPQAVQPPQPPPTPAPEPQQSNQTAALAPTSPPSTPANQHPPAPVPQTDPFHLTLGTDLVLVPVVVRDAAGHAVANLTKDDFQLFDKGKRQQIVAFNLETQPGQPALPSALAPAQTASTTPPASPPAPPTFTVYLIDDIHLKVDDLVPVREAARRHIAQLPPAQRAAVITTSGTVTTPMTIDRKQIDDALGKLRAEPLGSASTRLCPNIDYYMAEMILNAGISNPALQAASREAFKCMNLPPSAMALAQRQAMQTARNADALGERETRAALLQIRDVIRWLANAPGRRSLILVSSGFILNNSARFDEADLIDQAIRAQVTIGALDARGVYDLNPAGQIEDISADPDASRIRSSFAADRALAVAAVMGEIANGTGGQFIQNTNDLYAGLERLASPPEVTYILAFKPSALKQDGSYHPLAVKLDKKSNLTLQSRRGYFAPKN